MVGFNTQHVILVVLPLVVAINSVKPLFLKNCLLSIKWNEKKKTLSRVTHISEHHHQQKETSIHVKSPFVLETSFFAVFHKAAVEKFVKSPIII